MFDGGLHDTPGVVGGEPTLPDPTPRDLAIETLVERVSTLAGEALSVTCVVSENREQVRDVATLVAVDGQPLAETTDGVASLTLVTRGTYIVSCEGVDELSATKSGWQSTFSRRRLSRSKLPLAPRAPAEPFDIGCSLEDAFGNCIERLSELPAESSLTWDGDVSLLRESQDELTFERVGPLRATTLLLARLVSSLMIRLLISRCSRSSSLL